MTHPRPLDLGCWEPPPEPAPLSLPAAAPWLIVASALGWVIFVAVFTAAWDSLA